jgi:hypothetical protein
MGLVEKPKGESFDNGPLDANGQYRNYAILPQSERDKGFIRPVRQTYIHITCGASTSMGREIAETYARDNKYYGATFCVRCRDHFPLCEFVWEGTEELVGS